jgi:tetratricopeptide (TPR) repeat protein
MRRFVSCPADEVVLAFIDGQLSSAQASDITRHIDPCDACRELVAELAKSRFRGDLLSEGVTVGRYHIRGIVGTGGMGVVYDAHDPALHRRVALKLIKDRLWDVRGDERLLLEAELMAQLQHPNVVVVYDVGTFGDQIFVAMELVDGLTLSTWMKQGHSIGEVIDVFGQAGRGLLAAHRAGLVHRDFKPDNVLIGSDARVRVSDFGLARATPVRDVADALDMHPDAVVGTPVYMAPEQLTGGTVDARTDQFCFCVALYEAIYGQRPFVASSWSGLKAAVTRGIGAVPHHRGVSPRLRRALQRGLSVAPGDRFPSLDELLLELTPRPRVLRRVAMLAIPALALALALVLHARASRVASEDDGLAPTDAVAAQAFTAGLEAMRAGEFSLARHRLELAVAFAPGHALARASLAEVLKALGYEGLAEAEARVASAATPPTSPEARLLVQGRCAVAEGKPGEAATAFAALFAFRRDNVEYGIELAQAALDDGRAKDAAAVVANLRQLSLSPTAGLRIAELDAVVKEALGDLAASQRIAADAAARARLLPSRQLEQEGLFDEAIALYRLGRMDEALRIAEQLAREARTDLPIQQAMTAALLGNIYLTQDRLDDAERQFREDLRISLALGSRSEVTTMLDNLGTIAAARGDEAAEVAVLKQTLPLVRERGTQRELTILLANLSDSLTHVGALHEALDDCEEARDVAHASNDRSSYATASAQCARVRARLGELTEAKRLIDAAVTTAREIGDKDRLVWALFSAYTIARTRGQSSESRAALAEATAILASTGGDRTDLILYVTQVDLDEGRFAQAIERARPIAERGHPPLQGLARAFLAQAALERQNYAAAIEEAERALNDAIAGDLEHKLLLLGVAGRAYAAMHSPKLTGVTARLTELAKLAEAQGDVETQLGSRLVFGQLAELARAPRWQDQLAALAQEAEHRGFMKIAVDARVHSR